MRSWSLFIRATYRRTVGPRHVRVAKNTRKRNCALQRQPTTMTFLRKSVRKWDNADDLSTVVEPCRKLRDTAVGDSPKSPAQTGCDYAYEGRAATRGSLRVCVTASCLILMIHVLISFLVAGAMASRALHVAGSGTRGRGNVRSRLRADNTVFSHDSRDTGACSQRRIGRNVLTPHILGIPDPGSQLPSRLLVDSSTARRRLGEKDVSSSVTSIVLPHKSGEAVHLTGLESDGHSFVAAEETLTTPSDSTNFGQPRQDQWVCRISVPWGACGWRQAEGRGEGWICPADHCCSKTACKNGACLGGWCVHNRNALCWIKDDRYGAGRCSCQNRGGACSGNAICHTMAYGDGGTYCTCAPHFLGDGKTCKANPCQSNPCSPGSCSPRGDSYVCDCPNNTHELVETHPPACVAKKNPCMSDPCGPPAVVDSCLNFEVDYECICKDGYVAEDGICEKVDWCKGDPCGPPGAVHDCVSIGMGFRCYCQRGYIRQRDDEGLEYCAKDFCAEKPCGDPEFVESCTNRSRRRAATNTDEDSEAYPRYSCLCSEKAELKIDPETNEGQCVRADPCKGDPCGPPEAVAQCFVHGLSYGCACKAGYTAQSTGEGKGPKCVAGDPCVLKACGEDEFVDNCTTDGKTYTCHCSEEGFLSHETTGVQICRSKALCEENCGPTEAVTRCTPNEDTYECVCKQGFLLAYNKGKRSCVAGDPCAVAPCGSTKAVAECRREAHGYSCVCNRGYEIRNTPDGTQLCAEPQSCVGDPCGPAEAVELCLSGKYTYSCKCRESYVVKESHGRQRCTFAVNDGEEGESTPTTDSGEKTESGDQQVGLFAGVAIAGVVLVGSAYAVIMYVRKGGPRQETPENWDSEGLFSDFLMEGAPYASSMPHGEQGSQEAAILPSPSAWG